MYGEVAAEFVAGVFEPWTGGQQGLMRREECLFVALADQEPDDGALEKVDVGGARGGVLHGFFLEGELGVVDVGVFLGGFGGCCWCAACDDYNGGFGGHGDVSAFVDGGPFEYISSVCHCVVDELLTS